MILIWFGKFDVKCELAEPGIHSGVSDDVKDFGLGAVISEHTTNEGGTLS